MGTAAAFTVTNGTSPCRKSFVVTPGGLVVTTLKLTPSDVAGPPGSSAYVRPHSAAPPPWMAMPFVAASFTTRWNSVPS